MGCDIHGPWVYGKQTLGSTSLMPASFATRWNRIAELNWARDYCVFSIIANVRNDGHSKYRAPRGAHPAWLASGNKYTFEHMLSEQGDVVECRELHQHRVNDDCHSQSWLTTDELVECQLEYVGHSHGWGGARRTNTDIAVAIALMRTAESMGYSDVHIGFCFDN